MNNRFKNIYFWIGIVGVVLTAMNIDIHTVSTWNALFMQIVEAFRNPSVVVGVIMALIGVFVDPTSEGIKDNKEEEGL